MIDTWMTIIWVGKSPEDQNICGYWVGRPLGIYDRVYLPGLRSRATLISVAYINDFPLYPEKPPWGFSGSDTGTKRKIQFIASPNFT